MPLQRALQPPLFEIHIYIKKKRVFATAATNHSFVVLATAELFPNDTRKQQKNDKSAFGSDALD